MQSFKINAINDPAITPALFPSLERFPDEGSPDEGSPDEGSPIKQLKLDKSNYNKF